MNERIDAGHRLGYDVMQNAINFHDIKFNVERMRDLLKNVADEIEKINFQGIEPVQGIDIVDVIDILRGDLMPRPLTEIFQIVEIKNNDL
jgi:hypothetical protein